MDPQASSTEQLQTAPPKLLTNRVTEHFFARVLAELRPISSLTIAAPWISRWEAGRASFDGLCENIQRRQIRTVVLTRPPLESWHSEALNQLSTCSRLSIYLIPNLHAKIFICEAIPFGFGLVGSPNLTAQALRNFEVGVLFEARGVLTPLLKELHFFVQDLRRLATSKYVTQGRLVI